MTNQNLMFLEPTDPPTPVPIPAPGVLVLTTPEAVRRIFSRDHCIGICLGEPYAQEDHAHLQFRWEPRSVLVKGQKAVDLAQKLFRCSVGRIG